LTKGWLKPKLLLEVTGMPAATKVAMQFEKQRRMEQRDAYIKKYTEGYKARNVH